MTRRRGTGRAAHLAVMALAVTVGSPPAAAPLSREEVATLCARAEGAAHCGRLVEETQLQRLPNLAVRDGQVLRVTLYPAGVATFTDTEGLDGGRSFSLWDYLDPINAVLLYTTNGDAVGFTLLQRASGRTHDLPTEPGLSPDRQRLVTADFCASRCVNELAVWRVTREGVRKELVWKPSPPWGDATAAWKDAQSLAIEYTPSGATASARLERRLSDPDWIRAGAP